MIKHNGYADHIKQFINTTKIPTVMAENTLYRQVSFEDGFDLISNGNDDKFIYLKEVPEQEQEEVWDELYNLWDNQISVSDNFTNFQEQYHLIKKQ